ncbi:putative nicotinamide-nucleotide adenylyltransferase NMA2 [Paratrimastix pyriformis]|uniref:Nicotinamide-nucleotide adenylyltransferase NMA2 n=1 Tax=Paratrimastix pyriformis TaxID=342808 RepID=A0ABQ8UIP4_9EUKA|nr:putative nicotinamide-nucleotide adenylyltransferase NMA2 [Paratrimastix pyriformis]
MEGTSPDVSSPELQKLAQALRSIPEGPEPLYCLLLTGSLNPVHRMHVSIFDLAKRHLESTFPGMMVVAGWISPSHDQYVSHKLGHDFIPGSARLTMCRLAVAQHPWVSASAWETEQSGFVDFPECTERMQQWLKLQFPRRNLKVLFICGADHAVRCHIVPPHHRRFGVVCLTRDGKEDEIKRQMGRFGVTEGTGPAPFFLVPGEPAAVSSTEVRCRLLRGEPMGDLLHPDVEQWLRRFWDETHPKLPEVPTEIPK